MPPTYTTADIGLSYTQSLVAVSCVFTCMSL